MSRIQKYISVSDSTDWLVIFWHYGAPAIQAIKHVISNAYPEILIAKSRGLSLSDKAIVTYLYGKA